MSVLPRTSSSRAAGSATIALLVLVTGCSLLQGLGGADRVQPSSSPADEGTVGDRYPDVLAVELRPQGDGTFDVAVTMSSAYDSPERYADGWRVLDAQGNELGRHALLHDHAAEQPFVRVQRGVVIPEGIDEITVQGRDLVNGFGGRTVSVPVPRE